MSAESAGSQPTRTRIIVDPGLTFTTPDNSTALALLPDGRVAKPKPFLQPGASFAPSSLRVREYLRTVKPHEYEIEPAQASIARALTAISVEGGEKTWEASFKYGTKQDLVEEIAQRNGSASINGITRLVEDATARVVEAYRTAMAVREHLGALPSEAPNINRLIDYLEGFTVEVAQVPTRPYQEVPASRLRSVFSREISAVFLVATFQGGRTRRRYVEDLERFMSYQQQSP